MTKEETIALSNSKTFDEILLLIVFLNPGLAAVLYFLYFLENSNFIEKIPFAL